MNDGKNYQQQIGILPFVFGGLSFIPLCGVPFGLASILWGVSSKKRGSKILAIMGAVGILVTVAIYGSLFYFGTIQRGGVYDSLRSRLAESNLTSLVQAIEFYKLQNDFYPPTLSELAKSQTESQHLFILDPTIVGPNVIGREFYYKVTPEGSNYYLLGLGVDGKPFTSDDILPKIETKNTGLLINPSSKSVP